MEDPVHFAFARIHSLCKYMWTGISKQSWTSNNIQIWRNGKVIADAAEGLKNLQIAFRLGVHDSFMITLKLTANTISPCTI